MRCFLSFRPDFSWEFLSADEIENRTIRALRNHIRHLKDASSYYKDILQDLSHEDITSISDFEQLKITSRDELCAAVNNTVCSDSAQIIETVLTNGVSGKPLAIPLTNNDIERLAFNEALGFHSIGINNEDIVQIMVSLDRSSMNSIAYYRGLMLLGCNIMRAGVISADVLKYYLDHFKPTVLITVPSFLKTLTSGLQKKGIDTLKSSVKKIICTSESVRTNKFELNSIGKFLHEHWNAEIYSTYFNSEIAVSYCECLSGNGGHAHPELVYTEIVDENGNVVPDGVPGELVATPLGVEGMPLLRYRTGDITFKISEPCSCGRSSVRIGPILGRKSHLIRMRDATLFPLTITNVLDEIHEINDYVLVIENSDQTSDRVAVHVAAPPSSIEKISNMLRNSAGVNLPILVSNIPTIMSMRGGAGKNIRIIDWRR